MAIADERLHFRFRTYENVIVPGVSRIQEPHLSAVPRKLCRSPGLRCTLFASPSASIVRVMASLCDSQLQVKGFPFL